MDITLDYSGAGFSFIPRGMIRRCIAFLANAVSALTGASPSPTIIKQRYAEAVDAYGALIDRLCFGYANTTADFDDLKQDVLLSLWESMPRFKEECSMKTWVYRLTLNVCVSSLRKNYRKVTTVQLTEMADIVDYQPDKKEIFMELHEAIGLLNPLDKAIMILWIEEERYEGIAEITGVTKANVATRIHRAKDKLKTIMEK